MLNVATSVISEGEVGGDDRCWIGARGLSIFHRPNPDAKKSRAPGSFPQTPGPQVEVKVRGNTVLNGKVGL